MDYGIISLLPPLLTIALAVATKQVLPALVIGGFSGAIILSGNANVLDWIVGYFGFLSDAATDPDNVGVFVLDFMIGITVALFMRGGGAQAVADWASVKLKKDTAIQAIGWGATPFLFIDDMFSCMTITQIIKPVTDHFKVSRENLSFIMDTSAVSACCLVPISSWFIFVAALLGPANEAAGIGDTPVFGQLIGAIPYAFYAWLSFLMVAVVIFFKMDFGPMAKAERRAKVEGIVCKTPFSGDDGGEDELNSIKKGNGTKKDLFIPLGLLIGFALFMLLYTGGFFQSHNLTDALGNADGCISLCYGMFLADTYMIIKFMVSKVANLMDCVNTAVMGVKAFVLVNMILLLAWTLGNTTAELDTAGYLVSIMVGNVPGFVLPLLIFLATCAVAFSTGASWATYALMMPIAVPLAVAMGVDVLPCIAAVMGGGAFGNHCSPIADTAILSSVAADIFHMDHIRTQIPYSVTSASVACVGFLLAGVTGGAIIPLVVALIIQVAVIFVLYKKSGGRSIYEVDSSDEGVTE